MTISVLVVDDHPLVLDALRAALIDGGAFAVYTATGVGEGRTALQQLKPDVLVSDVRLPDGSGLELIREARTTSSATSCIVLSSFDTPQYAVTARRLGAAGYLLKTESAQTIIAAIRMVATGGTAFGALESAEDFALSDRERAVIAGVVAGKTNDEVAGGLGISRKGVEAHLSRLYERAGVVSRTELALKAEREGWLEGT